MAHETYTERDGTEWAGMIIERAGETCEWCKGTISPGSFGWRASKRVMHNDCLTTAKETLDRQMDKDD